MELEERQAEILGDIRSLINKGYSMQLSYSPSASDAWEEVTLEWIEGEMEAVLEYRRQEYD